MKVGSLGSGNRQLASWLSESHFPHLLSFFCVKLSACRDINVLKLRPSLLSIFFLGGTRYWVSLCCPHGCPERVYCSLKQWAQPMMGQTKCLGVISTASPPFLYYGGIVRFRISMWSQDQHYKHSAWLRACGRGPSIMFSGQNDLWHVEDGSW